MSIENPREPQDRYPGKNQVSALFPPISGTDWLGT